jgi:hypothetical protein
MAIHMHLNNGMVYNSINLTIKLVFISMDINIQGILFVALVLVENYVGLDVYGYSCIWNHFFNLQLNRIGKKLLALMCMGIHMHLKPLF